MYTLPHMHPIKRLKLPPPVGGRPYIYIYMYVYRTVKFKDDVVALFVSRALLYVGSMAQGLSPGWRRCP